MGSIVSPMRLKAHLVGMGDGDRGVGKIVVALSRRHPDNTIGRMTGLE